MISIAMCTYNGAKYLKEQLQSIMQQTLPPDELIICDDCSKDNTVDVINQTLVSWTGKWKLIQNKYNLGFRKNFQKAIENCNGDIIFLSDQDDVWHKDKIEKIMKVFSDNPSCILAFHDAVLVDGNLKQMQPSFWQTLMFQPEDFLRGNYKRLMESNVVQGAACAFRKKLYYTSLPFPSEAYHDEWLALNAITVGTVIPVLEKLLDYRQTGSNAIGVAQKEKLNVKIKKWLFSFSMATEKHVNSINRRKLLISNLLEHTGKNFIIGDNVTLQDFTLFYVNRLEYVTGKINSSTYGIFDYNRFYLERNYAINAIEALGSFSSAFLTSCFSLLFFRLVYSASTSMPNRSSKSRESAERSSSWLRK